MKTLTYNKLFITITRTEEKNDTFIVNLKIKNNAPCQTIIFPNEEIRLLVNKEVINLDNYKFENNLDPGQETEGSLFFKISGKPKKATLQFGKLVLTKKNVNI